MIKLKELDANIIEYEHRKKQLQNDERKIIKLPREIVKTIIDYTGQSVSEFIEVYTELIKKHFDDYMIDRTEKIKFNYDNLIRVMVNNKKLLEHYEFQEIDTGIQKDRLIFDDLSLIINNFFVK